MDTIIADATTTPAKPELQEIATVARDIFYPAFLGLLINQDDTLLQRGGGKGLKLYDEIERDCHAFAVLQKRKLAILARPWEVTPASESAIDKAAADIVKEQLTNIGFDQLTLDLLDAILKGYAVGEIMWERDGAQIVAKKMIARNQRRFVFDVDYQLHLLTRDNMTTGELMPERKFIVHSYGAKDGNPYGLGLGSRLFWPVFFKRKDIIFWLTFADKFGSPTGVGKYPPGSPVGDQQKLLDALAAIAQDTGITIPEGMSIELLEAQRSGSGDAYEKLAKYLDDQISEGVLGETMSTNSRSAGLGQGGQAQVHNEVRLELVKADADLLSGTLNETLVKWICEFNAPGSQPPMVWRKVEEPTDLTAQATRDKLIFDMGYKPTLQYIVDTYGGEWTDAPPPPPPVNPFPARNPLAAAFAEAMAAATQGQSTIDAAGVSLPDAKLQTQMALMLTPVLGLIRSGASYSAIMTKLAQTFPQMDSAGLEELLARAIFVADLWGGATLTDAGADVGAD